MCALAMAQKSTEEAGGVECPASRRSLLVYSEMQTVKLHKMIPREPSMSFLRANAEYGSARSMSDASMSNTDASSTRVSAGGMSCFKIGSSLLLIVS